ncbi:MAG: GIN domain-containing protein [Casimicrobium sp.]
MFHIRQSLAVSALVVSGLVGAQVNIQGGGSSVKVDGSGVSINAPGASVNAGAAAGVKAGKGSVASTGGKCVNGTLSVKASGVGDRKLGALECDLVVIENAAVGDMTIGSVKAKELRATLSGTGNLLIGGGSAESATFSVAGTGDLKAAGLATGMSSVAIGGVGNVEVNAEKTLTTVISGTGDVLYRGNAKVSNKSNGVGEVKRM